MSTAPIAFKAELERALQAHRQQPIVRSGGDPTRDPMARGDRSVIERALRVMGIQRADVGLGISDDLTPLDQSFVTSLVWLIPNMVQWLGLTSFDRVPKSGGKIGIIDTDGIFFQDAAEATAPAQPGLKPTSTSTSYATKKITGKKGLTREEFRKAREAGISPEMFVLMNIAQIAANNLAQLIMRGDESLTGTGLTLGDARLEGLLKSNDGILKLLDSNGVAAQMLNASGAATGIGAGLGSDFGAFFAMWSALPDEYKHASSLQWLIPHSVDAAVQQILWNIRPAGAVGGSQGSALGDRQLGQRVGIGYPFGIPATIVPTIPTTQSGSLGQVTPDSVTDSSGNVLVDAVTGLGDHADLVGRRVRVVCKTTGQAGTATIAASGGGATTATVTGSLGQSTISTTAADYTVELYDMTSMLLCNPRSIQTVMYDRVRVYTEFDPATEVLWVHAHLEVDIVIHLYAAMVRMAQLITPTSDFATE